MVGNIFELPWDTWFGVLPASVSVIRGRRIAAAESMQGAILLMPRHRARLSLGIGKVETT